MDNVHELIIATLSDHPAALTITEIASFSGLNRHAVARHLDTLELLGKVRKIQQGNAKKYFRVTSVPVSGLIDISSDLIIIVDKNLVIQYINNAAEQKLGLPLLPREKQEEPMHTAMRRVADCSLGGGAPWLTRPP